MDEVEVRVDFVGVVDGGSGDPRVLVLVRKAEGGANPLEAREGGSNDGGSGSAGEEASPDPRVAQVAPPARPSGGPP